MPALSRASQTWLASSREVDTPLQNKSLLQGAQICLAWLALSKLYASHLRTIVQYYTFCKRPELVPLLYADDLKRMQRTA